MANKYLVYKAPGEKTVLLDFEPEFIQLSKPHARQNGNRVCYITYYHDGRFIPLRLQFPKMTSPFALKRPEYKGNVRNHYEFAVNFYGEEQRPELSQFRDLLVKIQERLITLFHENSGEWFHTGKPTAKKKNKSLETIHENFCPLIRDGWSKTKNRQYEDNIPIKCLLRREMMQTTFFDADSNIQCYTEAETQHSEILLQAELREVWILNQYYAKFVATQVQVFPPEIKEEDYSLVMQ